MSARTKRILIVSDHVGLPAYRRGIFRYTVSLVRALHRCGHELVLLTERTAEQPPAPWRNLGRYPTPGPARQAGLRRAIYDCLGGIVIHVPAPAKPTPRMRRLGRWGLPACDPPLHSPAGLARLLHLPVTLPLEIVANDPVASDDLPETVAHLPFFDAFALCDGVYTLAWLTALHGYPPPVIDARGFDFVIVDSPTHLRLRHARRTDVAVVIHDLIPFQDPALAGQWRDLALKRLICAAAEASEFIFVSEATRQFFLEWFAGRGAKKPGAILSPGVPDDLADGSPLASGDYLLAIIADEPRKNLLRLIQAIAFVPPGIRLKVLGHLRPDHLMAARAAALRAGAARRIDFLGFVDEPSKIALLAGALGIVMPSLLEGFGIPLLEGAMFGKPVFCSDLPVFREVMGDHAFYFDPHDPAAIAATIRRYVENPASHAAQVAAARQHVQREYGVARLAERVAAHFGGSPGSRDP